MRRLSSAAIEAFTAISLRRFFDSFFARAILPLRANSIISMLASISRPCNQGEDSGLSNTFSSTPFCIVVGEVTLKIQKREPDRTNLFPMRIVTTKIPEAIPSRNPITRFGRKKSGRGGSENDNSGARPNTITAPRKCTKRANEKANESAVPSGEIFHFIPCTVTQGHDDVVQFFSRFSAVSWNGTLLVSITERMNGYRKFAATDATMPTAAGMIKADIAVVHIPLDDVMGNILNNHQWSKPRLPSRTQQLPFTQPLIIEGRQLSLAASVPAS